MRIRPFVLFFAIIILSCFYPQNAKSNRRDFKIKTFTPSVMGYVGNTYAGSAHPNGMIYFANGDGLLEFDGCYWRNISPPDFTKVLSVLVASNGLIYIAGVNKFGYLKVNSGFHYEYTSLREKLDTSITLMECWQIVEHRGGIYFQGYEQLIKWDGELVRTLPITDSYIFKENERLFASNFSGVFGEIKGDTLVPSENLLDIKNDAVYSVDQIGPHEYILLTAESGIFKYNDISNKVSFWKTPTSEFLETPGLYHSRKMKNGNFIATTWEHGVVIFDSSGRILDHFELELGLEKGGLREIFFDKKSDIWLCSDFGIVKLEYTDRALTPAPPIWIRKLLIDGVSFDPSELNKIDLEQRPDNLTLQFSCPGMENDVLEFSYYLEGEMADWSEWTSIPYVTFSDLQGGGCTFYLKARRIGDSGFQTKKLSFQMPLIWYVNPFFYLGITISFGALVFVFFRIRAFRLRKKTQELENQIQLRVNEIELQKKELESINEELKEKNLELDNFVYRSSHDLTAPLKSIRGLIELSRIENDHGKYLDLMETSLLRLESFIETVTAYSSNSKQAIKLENVVFEEIVDWVLDDLKFIKRVDELKIEKEIPKGLSLITDRRKLYIILNNLVNNSVKYQNYEQEQPKIRIGAKEQNGVIIFWVEDNGLGIRKEHLDRVFNMFFRASEKSEGSGLGLYIVKEAVEKLEGKIIVESIPGRSTEFRITLPSLKEAGGKTRSKKSEKTIS